MIVENNKNPRIIAYKTKFESNSFNRIIMLRRHNWGANFYCAIIARPLEISTLFAGKITFPGASLQLSHTLSATQKHKATHVKPTINMAGSMSQLQLQY